MSSGPARPARRHARGDETARWRRLRSQGRTLTLWQGPPGTGKTRTLLALIRAAVRCAAAAGCSCAPVLAAAPSNVAVDNIVEGLMQSAPHLRVVRIGPPAKARATATSWLPASSQRAPTRARYAAAQVAPALWEATLEAQTASTPQGAHAAALRARARLEPDAWAASALRQEARLAEAAAAAAVLRRAHVARAPKFTPAPDSRCVTRRRAAAQGCCTCGGAGDPALAALTFPLAVVDEATQARARPRHPLWGAHRARDAIVSAARSPGRRPSLRRLCRW